MTDNKQPNIRQGDRAKSDFLARVSHEIRTPISAIVGIAEIELQNKTLSPHIEESFAKIHNAAGSLLNIVNDILDISNIENGKIEITSTEYETASMISDIAHMQVAFSSESDVSFKMYVDENLPYTLCGDMLRITQVINNLISNAFKYTQKGQVSFSIKWSNQEQALVVCIQDTGVGMSSEQVSNLHEGFARFHEQQLQHIGGTGLGMSIVYSLVHLMNATMEIQSEINVGTTVVVKIPQDVPTKAELTNVLGTELAQRLQQFELFKGTVLKSLKKQPEPMPYGKVLVVDDMDANLYVTKGLLSFYELNIETCISGYEAINKIKQGNVYDIIFMDQMMPGIDGTETLKQLRELGYTRPIVALTANALIGQAEEFIRNGFDGFISKPIQAVHLNTILVKYIKDKQPVEVVSAALASQSIISNGDINKFQDSEELVEKIRIDFAKSHKNAIVDIKKALYDGDIKTAHRLTHSLKNLAGLIKEHELSQTAGHLEKILRERGTIDKPLLSLLEREHMRVFESIDVPKPQTTTYNKQVVTNILDRLEPLLKARNLDSYKFVEELRIIPEAMVLAQLVEDFDFDVAYKCLKALRMVL